MSQGAGGLYGTPAVNTVAALSLTDSVSVGIGNVTIVSNNNGFNSSNVITALTDPNLSTLTVNGTGGLTINGTLSTVATSLKVTNNETNAAGVTIATLSSSLTSLAAAGTGSTTISTLTDTAGTMSISESGTGTLTVSTWTDASLVTLSMTGNTNVTMAGNQTALKTINLTGSATLSVPALNYTGGITVNGASDNASSSFITSSGAYGAASGKTDTFILGNGNNDITDVSTAGTVNITVGTGSNLISVGTAANTTLSSTITLGNHSSSTGIDAITVGVGGTGYSIAANYVINGAVAGDTITFVNDASSAITISKVTGATSVSSAITLVETSACTTAHAVSYIQYGGNTYVAESLSGSAGATDTTIIELTGLHTFVATAGLITLAS